MDDNKEDMIGVTENEVGEDRRKTWTGRVMVIVGWISFLSSVYPTLPPRPGIPLSELILYLLDSPQNLGFKYTRITTGSIKRE